MLKKIIILFSLLLTVVSARADENSRQIIAKVAELIGEHESYRIDFSASAKNMPPVSGTYTVSGNRYRIKVRKQEQFSDGVARYEINGDDKEVVIDNVNPASRNILENPTRAFDFAPEEFTSEYRGITAEYGKACHEVRLVPVGRMGGITEITLYADVATGMPVTLAYVQQGEKLSINIDRFQPLKRADEKQFEFRAADYRGYEIIDFR